MAAKVKESTLELLNLTIDCIKGELSSLDLLLGIADGIIEEIIEARILPEAAQREAEQIYKEYMQTDDTTTDDSFKVYDAILEMLN